jgi:mono/diheme cytochrome c family protein
VPRLPSTFAASLLLAVVATAPLGAQASAVDSTVVQLAKGKKLFEAKGLCFTCHGLQGEGVLGPTTRLAAGKAWLHTKGTLPEIVALIKAGVEANKSMSGAAMPPRGGSRLTDAEVQLVAAYVLDLHKRTPTK